MLDALTNLFKTAGKLSQDKMVKKSLSDKALQEEIIRMNTMDQLYELGIDSQGKALGSYSPATIEGTKNFLGKKQKGQRYDHITLNDSGKFYDSFKFKNEDMDFIITADTGKGSSSMVRGFDANSQSVKTKKVHETDLVKEFGQDILGLTHENIGYVIPEVKNDLLSQLRLAFSA